jgi:hypothetical protein
MKGPCLDPACDCYAEIERLKQYACQCEASVHSTQEGYAELQQEIEVLKREVAFMASNDYVYSLTSEIERLKALIARAADALDFSRPSAYALSKELRKAAK